MSTNAVGATSSEPHVVLTSFETQCMKVSLGISGFGMVWTAVFAAVFALKREKRVSEKYAMVILMMDCLCNMTCGLWTIYYLSPGIRDIRHSCMVVNYLWFMTPSISWLLVLSIAVVRYLAVCKPYFYQRWFNSRVIVLNVLAIILFSLVICAPFVVDCSQLDPMKPPAFLGNYREYLDDYTAFYRITLSVVTSVFLIILYTLIIMQLGRQRDAFNRVRIAVQSFRHRTSFMRSTSNNNNAGTRNHSNIEEESFCEIEPSMTQSMTQQLTSSISEALNSITTIVMKPFNKESDLRTEMMFLTVVVLFLLLNLPYSVVEALNYSPDATPDDDPRTTGVTIVIFNIGFIINPVVFYFNYSWIRQPVRRFFRVGQKKQVHFEYSVSLPVNN